MELGLVVQTQLVSLSIKESRCGLNGAALRDLWAIKADQAGCGGVIRLEGFRTDVCGVADMVDAAMP